MSKAPEEKETEEILAAARAKMKLAKSIRELLEAEREMLEVEREKLEVKRKALEVKRKALEVELESKGKRLKQEVKEAKVKNDIMLSIARTEAEVARIRESRSQGSLRNVLPSFCVLSNILETAGKKSDVVWNNMQRLVLMVNSIKYDSHLNSASLESLMTKMEPGILNAIISSQGHSEAVFHTAILKQLAKFLAEFKINVLKAFKSTQDKELQYFDIALVYPESAICYAVIELKKLGENIKQPKYLGQCMTYIRHVLQGNPLLSQASCLLWNGTEFCIIQLIRPTEEWPNGKLKQTEIFKLIEENGDEVKINKDSLKQLVSFLIMKPEDFKLKISGAVVRPEKYLGEGATSRVFGLRLTKESPQVVAKVFKGWNSSLDPLNLAITTPQVIINRCVAEAQTLQQLYDCSVCRKMIELYPQDGIILFEPTEDLDMDLLIQDSSVESIWIPLFKGLAEIHTKGILNRDIRPPNLRQCNGNIVITDWGSAITIGSQCVFEGSLGTASQNVLTRLFDSSSLMPRLSPIEYTSSDDMVALVKCFVLVYEGTLLSNSYDEIIKIGGYWHAFESKSTYLLSAYEAAIKFDYEALKTNLLGLHQEIISKYTIR